MVFASNYSSLRAAARRAAQGCLYTSCSPLGRLSGRADAMQRPLRLALQALVVIVVLACLLAAAPSIALLRDAPHGSARAKASGRGYPRSLRASLLGQWPTSGGRAIAALQGALRASSGGDLAASASLAPWGGGDANASTATAAAAAAAAGPAVAAAVAVVSADAAPEQTVQVAQLVPEAVAAPSRSGLQLPEALLGRSSPSTPRQAGSAPAPEPAAPFEAQQQEPSVLAEAPAQAEPEAALGSAGAAPRQPAGAPSGEPSPQQSQPEEQQPAEEVSCMVSAAAGLGQRGVAAQYCPGGRARGRGWVVAWLAWRQLLLPPLGRAHSKGALTWCIWRVHSRG